MVRVVENQILVLAQPLSSANGVGNPFRPHIPHLHRTLMQRFVCFGCGEVFTDNMSYLALVEGHGTVAAIQHDELRQMH